MGISQRGEKGFCCLKGVGEEREERGRWTGEMKMSDRERERHCQRHTGGGKGRQRERQREGEKRGQSQSQKPNLITQSMQGGGVEERQGSIEFHDLKSAIGQIENAKRTHSTLPSISLSVNGSCDRLSGKQVEN